MINVLLVTLGVSYLTELSGLSLALGAFVAACHCRNRIPLSVKKTSTLPRYPAGLFLVTMGVAWMYRC